MDVAVVKRHGATIDEDASPLHRNDEIVKASTPSGALGWFNEVEGNELTCCEHRRAANAMSAKGEQGRWGGGSNPLTY